MSDLNLNLQILVVDDSSTMRRIIASALAVYGLKNVLMAEDGRDAWEKMQQCDVQLVLSDWNMPIMTGLDLLKTVRGSDAYAKVPFIMITAEAFRENLVEALQHEVSGYINKPFSPDQLVEKIVRVLNVTMPEPA